MQEITIIKIGGETLNDPLALDRCLDAVAAATDPVILVHGGGRKVTELAGALAEVLIPAARMLPAFPNETVDAITAGQIRQGRDFRVSPFRVQRGAPFVKALDGDGSLLAIGELKLPNLYHPKMVL